MLLWNELHVCCTARWTSLTDQQTHLARQEDDRIVKFLSVLNAEYEALRGQILNMDPTLSLKETHFKVLSEE